MSLLEILDHESIQIGIIGLKDVKQLSSAPRRHASNTNEHDQQK
jgi:hypothetical protein